MVYATLSVQKEAKLYYCFRRNEHPSVSLAFPPVGWHKTMEQ